MEEREEVRASSTLGALKKVEKGDVLGGER
jgi:hypothetical protein